MRFIFHSPPQSLLFNPNNALMMLTEETGK